MIRKLFIVFASGLVLGILLLSSAWVLGGPEAVRRIEEKGGLSLHHKRGKSAETTKSFPLGDLREMRIDLPLDLRFVRGEAGTIEITGPQALVGSLDWQDGRLRKAKGWTLDGDGITVTVTAREIPALRLDAPADVELEGLDQPSLDIELAGAGDIDASGKAGKVRIVSRGAGDIDLSKLDTADAVLRIEGVGDIDVNASGTVDAAIEGAGTVSLHRKPKVLTTRISGIGSVDHDY